MVELMTAAEAAGVFRPGAGAGWQCSRSAGSNIQAPDRPSAERGR
jgi:hypothetical protein